MKKHNYLVGYEGEGQCVYGKVSVDGIKDWVDLFTLKEARIRAGEKLMTRDGRRIYRGVVYKLVKLPEKK